MESVTDRFNDISFDAGPIHYKQRKLIESLVPFIERNLEEYERVSFAFLFFEDYQFCLDICTKIVNNHTYGLMTDVLSFKHPNWCDKFVECIFLVQNLKILTKFGFDKFDFDKWKSLGKMEYISNHRLLLYSICENLTSSETLHVMKSVSSTTPEKYLEIFILKMLLLGDGFKPFTDELASLNNPEIIRLLTQLLEDPCVKGSLEGKSEVVRTVNVSDDGVYPIKDRENVGLCFIINEVNFKKLPEREGSSEDVALLVSTMEYFKINVKTFINVKTEFFKDLDKTIDNYFKEKNYSVFFLVIMSHGEPDAIYTSDNRPIRMHIIKGKLMCSRSLYKIPKVLIVQACQGPHCLMKGLTTDGPTSSNLLSDEPHEDHITVKTHISDLLTAMSTVQGFKAFRNITSGSWFIQALCKCMIEHENECIYSIITETIRKVKSYPTPVSNYPITQQPEFTSLFEKKLYLKPKKNLSII